MSFLSLPSLKHADPFNVLKYREHHDGQFIATHVGHVVTESSSSTLQ